MQHKHLGETLSFRCALGIPLALGAILGALIALTEGFTSICFNSSCVQNFFTIYKFPIAIAGFALPLIAMVAALQRSREAALQLDEAQLNNRFGNYLKHREGFESLINNFCDKSNIGIPRTLDCESFKIYRAVFPESGFNNPLWVGKFDNVVMRQYDEQVDRLLAEVEKKGNDFDIMALMDAMKDLRASMHVSYSKYKMAHYTIDGVSRSLSVPSLIDTRFCLIVCLIDVLEVYGLLKSYANDGASIEYPEMLSKTDIVKKVKRSISSVDFKIPPSYQNTDIPAES